ncbi:hypothetical protein [Ruminococcus sp.]|uniref:hypothetical protein n=1 Tax=Ruminococcus sp. TaxID=41978 RepID=UPI0025F01182|nr:hypothetical protein [Ruminococcus sp.]
METKTVNSHMYGAMRASLHFVGLMLASAPTAQSLRLLTTLSLVNSLTFINVHTHTSLTVLLIPNSELKPPPLQAKD